MVSANPDFVETSSAGEVRRTSGLSANNETLVESMEFGIEMPKDCAPEDAVRERLASEERERLDGIVRTRLG